MQARETASSNSPVLFELSTENGRIRLGGQDGSIELQIEATLTDTFEFDSALYDLVLIAPNGFQTRIVEGKVKIDRAITR